MQHEAACHERTNDAESERSPTRNSDQPIEHEVRLYLYGFHSRGVSRTDFVWFDDGMNGWGQLMNVDAIVKVVLRVTLMDELWVMNTIVLRGLQRVGLSDE